MNPSEATHTSGMAPHDSTLNVETSPTLKLDNPAHGTAIADTVPADTVTHDTLYAIVLEDPPTERLPLRKDTPDNAVSWIMAAALLLFFTVAVRFRHNSKFIGAMLRDVYEVRERRNVFDDTVRERTFLVLLNTMYCISLGILSWLAITWCIRHGIAPVPAEAMPSGLLTHGWTTVANATGSAWGMALCSAVWGAYIIVMTLIYITVGWVFSDTLHMKMWVRGFWGSNGLATLLLFPAAVAGICWQNDAGIWTLIGAAAFIMGKMAFIWKGLRIFFTPVGSWVLFLYYLCSLELLPIIAAWFAMCAACAAAL